MNAAQIIKEATAIGIDLAIDGDDLLLESASQPPRAVVDLISRYKPDILLLLRLGGGFADAFAALERKRPDYVELERWQQCLADTRQFLSNWGRQAEALGWTAADLLGLHQPPLQPHPSYQRLSRYDETGLLWLLQGRLIVALTETTAAIQVMDGLPIIYRRHNKPALGPVGDSLKDLV
jgi:hypothetical protein